MREQTEERLTGPDAERVAALTAGAAEADGHVPLSEEARLAVAHGRAGSVHLIEHGPDGAVLGYAYIAPQDGDEGRSCELMIQPSARGAGLGTQLARSALTAGATRFWAHGAHPGARRIAAKLGLRESRELRLLSCTGWSAPASAAQPPAGVTIRRFVPGEDDERWLAVNAAAFAHHPEQGAWTKTDLAERMAEPWFDPAGFFLAQRDSDRELLGFHWTKTHPAGAYEDGAVGEVYVLGISPAAQGAGLGKVLLHTGMAHLAARGLRTVVLYVDGDNTSAVRLYEGAGFRTRSIDLEYRRM